MMGNVDRGIRVVGRGTVRPRSGEPWVSCLIVDRGKSTARPAGRTVAGGTHRRGLAVIAVVILLVIIGLILIGSVAGGARDHDLLVRRVETVNAFYAAEAGVNLSVREMVLNSDFDGDGTVGTISDDGNPGNDPAIGSATVSVTASTSGSTTTLTSTGRAGLSRRVARAVAEAGSGGGSAMIVYGRGSSTPRYRLWNGASWGTEAQAGSIGTNPCWIVCRGAPNNDQFALATLDNDVDIEVQIWDGSAWGSVFQATSDAGDKSTRLFDLAYEDSSGELLLVYRESGTSSVRYRTHNGVSWSGESSFSLTSGTIRWLRLVPEPDSDEIMIIAASDSNTRAAIWNGSSFGDVITLHGSDLEYAHVDGGYIPEWNLGVVLYSEDDSTPAYRVWIGGWWSSELQSPSVGATPEWLRVCMAPDGGAIFYGTQDTSHDINVAGYSTSGGFISPTEVTTQTADRSRRGFDIAYEQNGDALIVYDADSNTLRYRTWDGSGWSAQQSGPQGGNRPIWNVQAVPGLGSGQIFVTWNMDNSQIRTAEWNGSSFGATQVLGPSGTNKEFECFMAATSGQSGGGGFHVTAWSEIESP